MGHDVKRKSSNVKSFDCSGRIPGSTAISASRLYAASNHMNVCSCPSFKSSAYLSPISGSRRALGAWSARRGRPRSLLRMEFGTLSPMLQSVLRAGTDHAATGRPATNVACLSLYIEGGFASEANRGRCWVSFTAFWNMPLDELTDLKDRLHHFREIGRTKEVARPSRKALKLVS